MRTRTMLLASLMTIAVPVATLAQTATVTSGGGPTVLEAQREGALGPKARIAVAQFKDKTGKGWWTGAIGDGMADMLSTQLFNTNRFIVLERQTLGHVLAEQNLAASGRVTKETGAPIGQIEGAELLVVGAVTEFQPGTQGMRGGIGGAGIPGAASRIIGGLAGGFRESHLALDMRLVDARTSRVVAATSVEGKAQDFDLGGVLGGYGSGVALGAGLGGWSKTPMEKALRIALNEAVNFVSSQTPTTYFRHVPLGAGGAVSPLPAPPPPPTVTPAPPPAPPAASASTPATPGAAKSSAEERLRRLDELKQKNLLTEEEYRQKRQEILKDL
jgi:curli biogenesis system outer membrane secretion channel CsgG